MSGRYSRGGFGRGGLYGNFVSASGNKISNAIHRYHDHNVTLTSGSGSSGSSGSSGAAIPPPSSVTHLSAREKDQKDREREAAVASQAAALASAHPFAPPKNYTSKSHISDNQYHNPTPGISKHGYDSSLEFFDMIC